MGGYMAGAGVYLIDTVFGLYIFAVLLRFLFQMVRADFYNPLCQAIVKVTNPALRPLRRYIPAMKGIDTASVVLLVGLQAINTLLVVLIIGANVNPIAILIIAVAELLNKTVWAFMGAILIQVIVSWISPGSYNPVMSVIHALSEPLMRPARQWIPPLGGIDFSPMFVLVALRLVQMVGVAPLRDIGASML
jgi:YggT family protein